MKKLEVRNISKSFDGKDVLRDVSIELNDGELVCLLGVSGSGKSTLFNIISGIIPPDSGEILLDGKSITNQSGHISYMLQKDMLLPYRTIEDNVALPLMLKGTKRRIARQQVATAFARFGLEGTQKHYPDQLSGGMRQRAALLRTYMFSREVALLDEPFSALDALTKHSMHEWYLELIDKIHLSTLFITHDVDEAILLSDRIYLLGGSPAGITHEFVINEPRAQRNGFSLTAQFIEYKRKILALL